VAARNGVGQRVDFRGEFTPTSFVTKPDGRLLVLCDVEGAEVQIVDPVAHPALLQADIVVEVHDAGQGTIEDVLRHRFAATHRIRRVVAAPRGIDDVAVPLPASLSRKDVERAIHEGRRYGLIWLFMTARQESDASS
jgi:hypothetical protein